MQQLRPDEISALIKRELEQFEGTLESADVGTITQVGDGIARIYGLAGAGAGELLAFPGDLFGMALNLESDSVGAILLGPFTHLSEGDEVRTTGRVVEVPVGPELKGRVVNALGQPIDGRGPLQTRERSHVEKIAPGVITRQQVNRPLQTGIKAIDALIPIGRGQRELIIGDRQTGKTAICLDTIINQRDQGVPCIYVAIGQSASSVAQVVATLEAHDALAHSIVVAATASDPAPMAYLAPYAGCAMGEYFRDRGEDALVVYDDLTKHAWAYRQISLLLRRPPGREAYPGDVFYLHSRLLERAANLTPEAGGGSLTALPIIETLAGDISAYIPTNVISITDGQLFLLTDLFYSGQRPAISPGLSVSRVGGEAQIKAMRQVAGRLRLDLAQYRELAAFAQVASDLDKATRDQLDRGKRMTELLKQGQYQPLPVQQQAIVLYAGANGFVDDVPVERIGEFEQGLLSYMRTRGEEVDKAIAEQKQITPETEELLKKLITDFKESVGLGSAAAAQAGSVPPGPAAPQAQPAAPAAAAPPAG